VWCRYGYGGNGDDVGVVTVVGIDVCVADDGVVAVFGIAVVVDMRGCGIAGAVVGVGFVVGVGVPARCVVVVCFSGGCDAVGVVAGIVAGDVVVVDDGDVGVVVAGVRGVVVFCVVVVIIGGGGGGCYCGIDVVVVVGVADGVSDGVGFVGITGVVVVLCLLSALLSVLL